MTAYLLLFGVIIGIPLQSMAVKQYQKKTGGGSNFLFTACIALFAMLLFFAAGGSSFHFDLSYLPYSAAFAVSYSISFIFQILALSCGPMSLTLLIQSYSLLLPTFYGILFLKEEAGLALYIGIALLAACIFLTNFTKGEESTHFSWKWFLFAWLSFLGNGMCSVIQKAEISALGTDHQHEFMVVALGMILIAFCIVGAVRERKTARVFFQKGWYWGGLCGLINGGVNLGVILLSSRMPASLQFPLVSAGSLLFSLFFSVVLYRERLSVRQCVGVCVGILAVICLTA